jgi:hypothetical protein
LARLKEWPRGYLCQSLSAFQRLLLITQIAYPGIDLAPAAEGRRRRSDVLLEWIFRVAGGTENSTPVIHKELDTVAFLQAEAAADLKRNRDLPFAADRAGWRHLY